MEIAGPRIFRPGRQAHLLRSADAEEPGFLAGRIRHQDRQDAKYSLTKHEWSVHLRRVAGRQDHSSATAAGQTASPRATTVNGYIYSSPKDGKIESEKLVNLAKHDYSLEPNATFTPDGKWIVFRSNMLGPTRSMRSRSPRSKVSRVGKEMLGYSFISF